MPKRKWKMVSLTAVLLAVFVGIAFSIAAPVHAQVGDSDYVDVAVILEVPDQHSSVVTRHLNIIVVNNGTRTAYDVEVVVDVVSPENGYYYGRSLNVQAPVGSVSFENKEFSSLDNRSLRWSIPALGGLQREEISDVEIVHKPRVGVDSGDFDNSLLQYEHFAQVSTSSFESDIHKGNNTSRVWSYLYSESEQEYRQAAGNYTVVVTVDDPSPSAGDTVNFTITAELDAPGFIGFRPTPIDTEVDIELTSGLTVSGTPTYDPSGDDKPDSVSYSGGVFEIGTVKARGGTKFSVTLPVTVASGAVVNEQCLTATLTGNPPPGTGRHDDDISDNTAKLCLALPSYFSSADLQEFVIHPCVGESNHPCDSTDDIRVRAITSTDPPAVLGVGTPLIHIPDTSETREYDDDTDSVNAEEVVSWQVPVGFSIDQYTSEHERWTFVTVGSFSYEMPGKENFDKLHIRASWAKALLSNDQREATFFGGYDVGATGNGPFELTAEFEKLGTYKVQYATAAKHDNNTDMDTSDDVDYSATGSYIFHVGPMADIAVEDGGASPHVAAGQNALTIVAVNNGPDDSAGTKVTGLPTGAQVIHVSHGSYDSSDGVWNIGELRVRGYYLSAGESDPTLVLSASDGDTASVTISNSDYEVCVGPESDPGNLDHDNQTDCEDVTDASWNSTPVYDYNSDNNTATITAEAGTGGHFAALRSADADLASIIVEWDVVNLLNERMVTHYEIEWSDDGNSNWKELADNELDPIYVDPGVDPGDTRHYRVRAVNDRNQKGPWSDSIEGTVEEEVMATAGAPGKPVLTAAPKDPDRREEILVSWTKPVENGSAIVSYTLEVSDTGQVNSWTDSGATLAGSATSWTHTGLTGGTRKFYRLLATNMCDATDPTFECHSLWSDPVSATTDPPGQSGPPTNVVATPDGDSAIDISWDPPLDDGGSPITRYDVQWSADGASGWRNAGSTPDAETTTLKNTGMTFGTTRYYRVAARNSVSLGVWSDPPVSATTLAGVPGQPNLTARATDASTIELTWTVPADNGSAIIRYELEWSFDGGDGSWALLINASEAETSYSDGGLNPGTERHYRIRAVNGATPGEGSWSAARSVKTPPAVPGAPFLRAEANGQNAINVMWDPPSDDGGADIDQYEVHVSTDGTDGSYSRLGSAAAAARSYTHSGLQPGDERYYRLRAHNSAGWGEFSEPVSTFTLTAVPAAPSLTARANGTSEIKLSWTKPDDRGSDILWYDLQHSDDGSEWLKLDSGIAADKSEYVHTGLSGGTTKHYRVRAGNGNGDGEWSASRSARTDAGGPDAPVLTLTVIGDKQIDLSWTVPADNGSSIGGYKVERSVDGDAPWEQLTGNNRTTTYSDTSLFRGVTRYYRVAAFNGAGTGPFSDAQSATTTGDPATAPGAPTLFRLSEVSRNQVTIAWEPPEDDGGAPVTGYEYDAAVPCGEDEDASETKCGGFAEEDIQETTGTSARISGLSTDGDYFFRARAVNLIGKGEWSQEIQTTLRPSSSGQVRVSPTTITVNEGATATYTISLSTAPPHPLTVDVQARGPGGSEDLQDKFFENLGSIVLIPSGWTHPHGEDWSDFTHNWSQGARFTFTAPEDDDADDDVMVVDHNVYNMPYDHYRPCDVHADSAVKDQCKLDWEDAWAASPYRQLTGASVIIKVNDND